MTHIFFILHNKYQTQMHNDYVMLALVVWNTIDTIPVLNISPVVYLVLSCVQISCLIWSALTVKELPPKNT